MRDLNVICTWRLTDAKKPRVSSPFSRDCERLRGEGYLRIKSSLLSQYQQGKRSSTLKHLMKTGT